MTRETASPNGSDGPAGPSGAAARERRRAGAAAGRVHRARSWRDLAQALAYLVPSLVVFLVFVFYPLVRNVQTQPVRDEPVRRARGVRRREELRRSC